MYEPQWQVAESMRQLADEAQLAAHAIRSLCTVVGPSDVEHVLIGAAQDLARLSGRIQLAAAGLEAQRQHTQPLHQLAHDARMVAYAVGGICPTVGCADLQDELVAVARDVARLSGRMTTTADCLYRRQ